MDKDWEMEPEYQQELDTCGLHCPLPILRTKKALAELMSGQVLKVRATDPAALPDFQAFARHTGNTLLKFSEIGAEYIFFLQKK